LTCCSKLITAIIVSRSLTRLVIRLYSDSVISSDVRSVREGGWEIEGLYGVPVQLLNYRLSFSYIMRAFVVSRCY